MGCIEATDQIWIVASMVGVLETYAHFDVRCVLYPHPKSPRQLNMKQRKEVQSPFVHFVLSCVCR